MLTYRSFSAENIGRLFRTRFKGSQFIVVSLKDGLFANANGKHLSDAFCREITVADKNRFHSAVPHAIQGRNEYRRTDKSTFEFSFVRQGERRRTTSRRRWRSEEESECSRRSLGGRRGIAPSQSANFRFRVSFVFLDLCLSLSHTHTLSYHAFFESGTYCIDHLCDFIYREATAAGLAE